VPDGKRAFKKKSRLGYRLCGVTFGRRRKANERTVGSSVQLVVLHGNVELLVGGGGVRRA